MVNKNNAIVTISNHKEFITKFETDEKKKMEEKN